MMKWKVYFVDGYVDGNRRGASAVETAYVGADTAHEAMNEAATQLGILDLDRFYVHAIPTGERWEEDEL